MQQRKGKKAAASREAMRPRATTGDEVGAAELGRRVADNLRARRKTRGMSLDDLARASGVSRAALSQIETYKSTPTVGLLWKVAVGLGVPFAELIGEQVSSTAVLRRADVRVLRSLDGKLESRPLTPAGTSPAVELYELRLAPRSLHASEPHAAGTTEVVVVLTGALRLHVGSETHDLGAGDSVCFPADRPHGYENPSASDARYHDLIVYAR
ncbi:MAG: helix-turn-helix transcriptional regulator [Myxococcales bacterium]|nr:helix-turn-helix transcriptional regulator [Myxococcales bacterium]